MKATLRDIARMTGISEAAVSVALNDKKGVSEETRKRVKDLAFKLGYRPDSNARSLVRKKSKTIGLIVPDIENPYYCKMVRCIENLVHETGYNLILAISDENTAFEKEIIDNFISNQVEGVIVSPINKTCKDLSHYELLEKRKIPLVFIAAKYQGVDAPCVMMDLEIGMYKLVDYLVKTGKRKMVFLTGPKELVAFSDRVRGYKRALQDNGYEYHDNDFIPCPRVDFEQAYFATMQLIKSNREVNTIIAANDYMAIGVLKALSERGIRVPHDISVTGYDDIIYASISHVPITTVAQDIYKMSQVSIDIILQMITQPNLSKPMDITIEPVLIVRESTATK